ncbi:hypothetical protein CAPTEDRAFT_72454, partial [Capitella teleta]
SKNYTVVPGDIPANETAVILSKNLLQTLGDNQFSLLTSLMYLVLSENLLTYISDSAFQGGAPISGLYLDDNQLSKIPNLSDVAATLWTLSCNGNQITTVTQAEFSGCLQLRDLKLENNPLLNYTVVPGDILANETAVILSKNLLQTLGDNQFSLLTSLMYLVLSENLLTYISDSAFQGGAPISGLYLDDN